jgi:hypothetical protein
MKAAPATGNEIIAVVVFAAVIAFGIGYAMNPKSFWREEVQEVVVVKPVKVKKVVADVGPGWASGRWLGEGDFHFAEKMRHPFADQPRYAGHPFHMRDMDHAPPGPRLPMP